MMVVMTASWAMDVPVIVAMAMGRWDVGGGVLRHRWESLKYLISMVFCKKPRPATRTQRAPSGGVALAYQAPPRL